jgi:phosphoribosylglycinamide formyltransferase-1
MRFAVFVSGSGTNLQALIDSCQRSDAASVVLVVSDRPGIGALERAARAGIARAVLDDYNDPSAIMSILTGHTIDFIVLAGYLRLIPGEVVRGYDGRMINIHPALLPSFGGKGMYGRKVHEAVIASGAKVTGPTIHLVTGEYDRGLILAQWPVPVHSGDTPDTLAARVLETEHRLLPAVVESIARHGPGHFQFTFSEFQSDSPTNVLDTQNNC